MSQIAEFYAGKTIFITGVSGYMGKVLLERILCTLPDIEKIYLLLRAKKGSTPEERIQSILSSEIFTFNNIPSTQFKKIFAVHGDISCSDLNLNEEDREKLINEVNVVVHLAAVTQFNEPLKDALMKNTISTKTVLELCTHMKNLLSIVHVSTAFCSIDIDRCEEKVYDVKEDVYEILNLVNSDMQDISEKEIIGPHPNTYTYTKRLAEIVARDMGTKLPLIIVRPSIVTPALKKPVEGWVDNVNGPVGMLSAMGVGIMRVALIDVDSEPDIIPVDCAINGIIAASWFRTQQKNNETPVINLTVKADKKRSWRYYTDVLRVMGRKYPHQNALWYPRGFATTNYLLYYFVTLFWQVLPALFVDTLLILFQQKPFLLSLQKRIHYGMKLMSYFGMRKFDFITTEAEKMFQTLSPQDRETFFAIYDIELGAEYMKGCYFGFQKYVLKDDGVPRYRYVRLKIFYILDILFNTLLCYGILWYICPVIIRLFI